jgi:hypothetical protein
LKLGGGGVVTNLIIGHSLNLASFERKLAASRTVLDVVTKSIPTLAENRILFLKLAVGQLSHFTY